MLNIQPVTELELSKSHILKLNWHHKEQTLSVEVWRPGFSRDGHGFQYHASVLLQGDELEAFVSAIAALQEPELRPAA
jgi:hypothetical protein